MSGNYLDIDPTKKKSSSEKSSDRIAKERADRKNSDGSFSNESFRENYNAPSAGEPSSADQSAARQKYERGVTDEDYRKRIFGDDVTADELQSALEKSQGQGETDEDKLAQLNSNMNYLKNVPESGISKIHNAFAFGTGTEPFTGDTQESVQKDIRVDRLVDRLAMIESRVMHPIT